MIEEDSGHEEGGAEHGRKVAQENFVFEYLGDRDGALYGRGPGCVLDAEREKKKKGSHADEENCEVEPGGLKAHGL